MTKESGLDPSEALIVGHYSMNGQDIVRSKGGEIYARIFMGNVLEEEKLNVLGITRKDVLQFLGEQLEKNGKETRLFDNFDSQNEKRFFYSYRVLDRVEDSQLTMGIELVYYRGTVVCANGILMSPTG